MPKCDFCNDSRVDFFGNWVMCPFCHPYHAEFFYKILTLIADFLAKNFYKDTEKYRTARAKAAATILEVRDELWKKMTEQE